MTDPPDASGAARRARSAITREPGPTAAAVGAAAVVALLVCLPLVEKGWLFLLDWTRGPHVPLPAASWGLDGGLLAAVPFALATWGLGELAGHAVLGWLPLAVALFAGCVSAAALVGGGPTRRLAAGLLYAVNPLVFERAFAGQVAFLLGYALLPLAVRSLLRAADAESPGARLAPALWITLLVGLAPHFAWLVAVVCLAILAARRTRRTAVWLAALAAVVLVANAYLILPPLAGGGQSAVDVGAADLAAYRTSGEPPFGPLGNVVGLHGFWRQEIALPKDDVPGWPLFWAAVMVVALAGAARGRRRDEDRQLVAVAAGAGTLGLLLALGDQGPTGVAYRWLYVNVPGFEIMREPQKFATLLALAYAVLFGLGAEALIEAIRRPAARRVWAAVLLLLPMLTAPTLLWGFAGRVEVGQYPSSWAEADRLMGDGPERVLFLPWHQYLRFPFTDRIVANPASSAFRRDVISGDNVELPGLPSASRSVRSAYLEFLYAHGDRLHSFGQLVAPHGVGWVVLAKAVDWQQYAWLDRQSDLEKVLDRDEIAVYRNRRTVGAGRRVTASVTVEDWGEVAGLSDSADLSGTAVRARREAPGRLRRPLVAAEALGPRTPESLVERRSPVRYHVPAGTPGWVVLAEAYAPGWRLGGRQPTRLAGGVTGFEVGAGSADARFTPWSTVLVGYAVTVGTVALVATAGFVARRRGRMDPVRTGGAAVGPCRME